MENIAKRVAFLCVHNSCRSQIAEALTKKYAGDVIEAYSAGTKIRDSINPDAVQIMKELYDLDLTKTQYPKLLQDIPTVDIIITMGCNVACPNIPGVYVEDWGLDDPSGKGLDEFAATAKLIEQKVNDLKDRIIRGELPL
ncbi:MULTISPECIES: arsenate reductase ArsC [unclassified Breznakia]|uniref:arsenate reductase ArsC n=1 Tax=unclassified Breznakia TaxID=2623764 RepID=UPI002474B087|nr:MULTISPECIES: arsenate reductase ArsC [unclassified Breznakia]MDH6368045.1 arsenate reductase [Breznakia sp. PH1-1]MDH6405133.1 arsenate reductase [Breznakia sp. PF1-11]MDH6412848.1 arsenate reductase [Breznakia sp. PFB1-11]MDH6415210.1 arsenate reductase [Breznakia sp. PFB1-14]MDH6417520.1 arsenate reductase [Breznakia sp. PFB1-4]